MANRAEQLNFLSSESPKPAQGQIIPIALHVEMQQSYLEYAMSVIVGRALPDVRDGLKPVHRRVIFAMHELGLLPDRPYRKCARVVGDVLGKYHPHGDQSVYDALVRLVQDFSSRYPLLAGHGNFGSVDNDPAAAMRYTECRLSQIGNDVLLGDINEAIIDFAPNFDGSQLEPTVLPAQLPMLLLNGSSGIAVGMATNIPPHNLGEVVDGLIALIDRPDLPDEKLFELIPAPDFPTGGIIVDDSGIKDMYSTGRGTITVRGVSSLETVLGKNRRSRQAIIITELPFQVNKAAWIEKIAELVNQNKLEGLDDLRDESDRTGMRVVIELKKDVNPNTVLESLYRQTALQSNFGAIMLALCGSLPKQLTLRELLQEFLNFRETTLTKRYHYELDQAQQRLHLVEGLVKALENIEDLIRLLRFAPDNATAKTQLQSQFEMSVVQAEAILSMPLRRLTAMEQSGLHKEQDELRSQITALEFVLGDRRELLKNIKKDLRQLKKKHGNNRRTRILSRELSAPKSESKAIETQELFKEAPKPEPKAVVVQLTQKGYIKTIEGKSPKLVSNPDDLTVSTYYANTDQNLIVLTSSGKALPIAIADIPTTSARASKNRGTPLVALLPESAEPVISHFILDKSTLDQTDQSTEKSESSLVFLTAQAKIKRSPLSDFAGINSRGLMVVKLAEDDRLFWGGLVPFSQELAIATSTGRILRMAADETQIPTLGRTAMGNQAIRLRNSEQLVGIMPLDWTGSPDLELLLLTAQGYAKRLKAKDLRLSNRASIGAQAMMFKNKDDYLTAIAAIAVDQKQVNFVITKLKDETQTQAIDLDQIPLQPCNGSGLNLSELGIESNLLKILPSK